MEIQLKVQSHYGSSQLYRALLVEADHIHQVPEISQSRHIAAVGQIDFTLPACREVGGIGICRPLQDSKHGVLRSAEAYYNLTCSAACLGYCCMMLAQRLSFSTPGSKCSCGPSSTSYPLLLLHFVVCHSESAIAPAPHAVTITRWSSKPDVTTATGCLDFSTNFTC